MAGALTIDFSDLNKAADKLKSLKGELIKRVDSVLDDNANKIANKAKDLAPVNFGGLRAAISADNSKVLEKHITANTFYAAFAEFGTGKFAAEYVSSLPETWQEYARQFKGSGGGGTFMDLVEALTKWVHNKQIAGTYSTKTQRRTGNKNRQAQQDRSLAYVIARSIVINGVHPHPFLFPAFEQQRITITKDVENVIKQLFK